MAEEAELTADRYRLQSAVYRTAVAAMHGPVQMRFHFTKPNVSAAADGAAAD